MPYAASFGPLLQTLRRRAGVSQLQLADAIGKTAQYISNIEKGKNNAPPDPGALDAMIAALQLSPAEAREFRLCAYADRGTLPPELLRYMEACPPLLDLLWDGMQQGLTAADWADLHREMIK
ncbi:MAG: helix-turn-helix transcriptional regulator [Clostridia bacterium]|nr:helix-turn-helix transcriptional regulator [Clostridia bacterium]